MYGQKDSCSSADLDSRTRRTGAAGPHRNRGVRLGERLRYPTTVDPKRVVSQFCSPEHTIRGTVQPCFVDVDGTRDGVSPLYVIDTVSMAAAKT